MSLLKKSKWVPPSKEVADELFVFGYSCKVFRDDEKALFLDQGKHLIPWMGNESVKIDRYDCRGALHDVRRYVPPPGGFARFDSLSAEEKRIEELCDEERYMALYKDEDEEALYHEEELKRLQQELSKDPGYAMVGFSYDDPSGSQTRETDEPNVPLEEGKIYLDDTYVPPPELDVPPGMVVPSTKKLNAIIQRTAVFIAKQGRQMEIVLKAKQSRNPQFGFLNFDHSLEPFYRHVIKMVEGGGYEPPPEEEPPKVKEESEASESDSDDGDSYLHPSLLQGAAKQSAVNPTVGLPHIKVEVKQEPQMEAHATPAPSTLDSSSSYGQLISQIRERQQQRDAAEVVTEPQVVKKEILEPTGELKVIIDKMASYVAKNGRDFEQIVKAKNDSRFDFVKLDHMYRTYYDFKVMKYEEMVKGAARPEVKEEKEPIKEDASKNAAPISFKVKPKEAEPVKLVPSSVQLGADEPEEGEEVDQTEPVPAPKQNVSINKAFMDRIQPSEGALNGGFGVIRRPRVEERTASPDEDRMELESSSSESDEELTHRTKSPTPPRIESPIRKPVRKDPIDIFADEQPSSPPPKPPPAATKPKMSIEDYKTRMLNRLKSVMAVESTTSTEIRRIDTSPAKLRTERRMSNSSESEDEDRKIKRQRKRRAALLLARQDIVSPNHSDSKDRVTNQRVDSPKLSTFSPIERRGHSDSRETVTPQNIDSPKLSPFPQIERQDSSDSQDKKTDENVVTPQPSPLPPIEMQESSAAISPASRETLVGPTGDESPRASFFIGEEEGLNPTNQDTEEIEKQMRERLEERYAASRLAELESQAASSEKERLLKQDRKQRAALLMARLMKEEKLPATQSAPSLLGLEAAAESPTPNSLPETSPPTPPELSETPGSIPTTPSQEIVTLESDEDIQIVGSVPGHRLQMKSRESSLSEDGEVSSSEEKPVPKSRSRSSSSSERDRRRHRSKSPSRKKSKERSKKQKSDRSRKNKKKKKKENARERRNKARASLTRVLDTLQYEIASRDREERSSRRQKSKRKRRHHDDENDEKRDKKKRRKEKRKRTPSSDSSSSSSNAESPVRSLPTSSFGIRPEALPVSELLRDEDSLGATSSVVLPTVAKLTEDLRAKVRALIESKTSLPS